MRATLRELLEHLDALGFGDVAVGGKSAATTPSAVGSRVEYREQRLAAGAEAVPAAVAAAERQADRGAQRAGLEALRVEAIACTSCRLAQTRKNVVFGSGNPEAKLMFIGEGPGANEDAQGLPFVGRAGELLTRIIQAIELEREEVYIANIVKCRPPGNRDPLPDEVAACIGFLRGQIRSVAPRVLVALGRVAAHTMLLCSTPLGELRGTWHEFEGVPLRVTYHPAALLRDPSLKRPTWEDMRQVRDRLLRPTA